MKDNLYWKKKCVELAEADTVGRVLELQQKLQVDLLQTMGVPPSTDGAMTSDEKTRLIESLAALSHVAPLWILRPVIKWVVEQPSRARTFSDPA